MTIEEMKAALEKEGYLVIYKYGNDPFTKEVKQYIHDKLAEIGKDTTYYYNMVYSNVLHVTRNKHGYRSLRSVPEENRKEMLDFLITSIQEFFSWKGWGP